MIEKYRLISLTPHEAPKEKLPCEYIIKASIEWVGGVKVLFISLFDQKKGSPHGNRAAFQVYCWDNGYLTQKFQEMGGYKWSTACIKNLMGWRVFFYNERAICECLSDTEAIENFCKVKCEKSNDALSAVQEYQAEIMRDKLDRKHSVIKRKIDEVMNKVPALPDDFENWVYDNPFNYSRYLYYKRAGRVINVTCTECHNEFEILESRDTKKSISHNNQGICPKCNRVITYKAIGKTKKLVDRTDFAIIQKLETGELVIRYFMGSKKYDKHYKNPKLSYYEHLREVIYIHNPSVGVRRYDWAYFLQTGEVRWCVDIGKKETPIAYLYIDNIKNVFEGTKLQYSGLYDFAKAVKGIAVTEFIRAYIRYPVIEYLTKLKLNRLLADCINRNFGDNWAGLNLSGKNIKEVFGVDMQLFKQMQKLDLGKKGFEILKNAAKRGKPLTDEQVMWLGIHDIDNSDFMYMMKYATPHKIIEYLKKQAHNTYAHHNVMNDWRDYIVQCCQLKYDLTNTFVLYPKNLKVKHEELTILLKSKDFSKYHEQIVKAHKDLEIYSFSDKNFFIRPANSVDEIVKEGHNLRHCVASPFYISEMAKKEGCILFIRKVDEPDKPFFTLQLKLKDFRVSQCRGYKNCDMTKEIEKFIEKWKANKSALREKIKVS